MIRVAVDAMGSDAAPAAEVDGAALALRELPPDFSVVLVGRADAIESQLARHPEIDRSRIRVVPALNTIGMGEKPLQAVRRKPDSSLVVGLTLHRDEEAEAFVSAGNTGAILAASTILLGLHDGVERASVASLFPAVDGPVVVLDAGANVDCTARELVNFAHLGSVYMRDLHGRSSPKVGLLNLGEEDEKGNAVTREAHQLLQADLRVNFVGNIEGRDIVVPHAVHGQVDVVVCDGFVGNVVLKFYESVGRLLTALLQRESPTLVGSAELKPMMRFLDYTETGGAPLLGVRGVSMICHGSSNGEAIKNAIRQAVEAVHAGLSEHIGAEFAQRESPAA